MTRKKNTMIITTMEMEQFLPVEIITEILSRLPVDSVIQCKRVCKTWRALIDDPVFVAVHTHRFIASSSSSDQKSAENHSNSDSPAPLFLVRNGFTVEYQFVEYNYDNRIALKSNKKRCPFFLESLQSNSYWELSSSCNGLVFMCFICRKYNHMFVCNPCTREYVNLVPSLSITNTSYGNAHGFGYHPRTKEYKIVIISYNESFSYGQVQVYTLGSGRWRSKGKLPNLLSDDTHVTILDGPGALVNGVLHWFVENACKEKIVLFDLEDEEFRVVPSPPSPDGTHSKSIRLFAGCLCVTRSNDESKSSDIWVMKNTKEYTWTRELSIPWKEEEELYCHRFLACLKRGKILLYSGFQHLVSYDPETDSFEKNESSDVNWCTFIPYEKSFVSLKALGEKDTKYVSV